MPVSTPITKPFSRLPVAVTAKGATMDVTRNDMAVSTVDSARNLAIEVGVGS